MIMMVMMTTTTMIHDDKTITVCFSTDLAAMVSQKVMVKLPLRAPGVGVSHDFQAGCTLRW